MEKKIDKDQLRFVAGSFPTGIAIVSLIDQKKETIGMTINSFLSVSLDPPIILFSADNDCQLINSCIVGKELSFNILSDNQKEISDQFAGLAPDSKEIHFDYDGDFMELKDASANYKTKINKIIKAGDHYLILCDVLECWRNENNKPIVFHMGYRNIGKNIE